MGYADEADSINHIDMLHVQTSAHNKGIVVAERRGLLMERMGRAVSALPSDSLMKDKMNAPGMAIAFLGLMRRTSQEWQAADFKEPELPDSMKVAATEICPTNDLYDVVSAE